MRIFVTGGCGFVGSNFIRYLLTDSELREDHLVTSLDRQTYTGPASRLEHMGLARNPRLMNVVGDICDRRLLERIYQQEKPEIVFNFAAEYPTDNKNGSNSFMESNVVGTNILLDLAKKYNVHRFVQISTDEVYGSRKEGNRLQPSNSYAASKAGADLTALAHFQMHGLPVVVTRSASNYGEYQSLKKLIPLFITNLIEGKKVPLMWTAENPGMNTRDWIQVHDNCRAIWFASQNGTDGEIYNIPGSNERTNMELTRMLLREFKLGEEFIERIPHKKWGDLHDFRHSSDGWKLRRIGFEHTHKCLEIGLAQTIKWYRENENWWRPLKDVCPSTEDNSSSKKQKPKNKIAANSLRQEVTLVRKGFTDLL